MVPTGNGKPPFWLSVARKAGKITRKGNPLWCNSMGYGGVYKSTVSSMLSMGCLNWLVIYRMGSAMQCLTRYAAALLMLLVVTGRVYATSVELIPLPKAGSTIHRWIVKSPRAGTVQVTRAWCATEDGDDCEIRSSYSEGWATVSRIKGPVAYDNSAELITFYGPGEIEILKNVSYIYDANRPWFGGAALNMMDGTVYVELTTTPGGVDGATRLPGLWYPRNRKDLRTRSDEGIRFEVADNMHLKYGETATLINQITGKGIADAVYSYGTLPEGFRCKSKSGWGDGDVIKAGTVVTCTNNYPTVGVLKGMMIIGVSLR